jgi:hypothetical protein
MHCPSGGNSPRLAALDHLLVEVRRRDGTHKIGLGPLTTLLQWLRSEDSFVAKLRDKMHPSWSSL